MCSEKTIIYLKAYISIKKKNLPISAMFQTFLPETNGLCSDKTWWQCLASLVAELIKESTCSVGELGWEDPLEKGTATHSSILA